MSPDPSLRALRLSVAALLLAAHVARAATPPDPSAPHYDTSYLDGPPPATPVPSWAFAMDPPASADLKPSATDAVPRHVPGSPVTLTRHQVLNHNAAADWHPDNHPPMPAIVQYGHVPQPAACAFCHLPNGRGAPENAPLAGLPAGYFIQQVHDFQNHTRRNADMRMASHHGMAAVIAPRITEDDLRAAAAYYASLTLTPYIKVVEAATVPRMRSVQYTMMPIPGAGEEPIGDRILETPADPERFHLLDDEAETIAYVPPGSVARGKILVETGDHGRFMPCVACHGADLRGGDVVPPIAGRGPSNLVRQLYNFKTGARDAPDAQPMRPVSARLGDADIVSIAAYLSSLRP